MINDAKIIMLLVLVSIASAYIRFKGFFQATVDAVLAFWFGYGMYCLLDYFTISGACRTGISCIVMLYARPLYDWGETFIRTQLTNFVTKYKKGGKDD
ncbi:MAG: hypothetical protein J6N45_04725 [Alphaproteobacteria bacterium]|nr:hypothetical protein [Alphaproteobacteria bacterium]